MFFYEDGRFNGYNIQNLFIMGLNGVIYRWRWNLKVYPFLWVIFESSYSHYMLKITKYTLLKSTWKRHENSWFSQMTTTTAAVAGQYTAGRGIFRLIYVWSIWQLLGIIHSDEFLTSPILYSLHNGMDENLSVSSFSERKNGCIVFYLKFGFLNILAGRLADDRYVE